MGCSESLPVVQSFEEPILMHIPMLYKEIITSHQHKLVVRAKLFSSSPYEVKTPDGYLFGNGFHFESVAARNQLILLDGENIPIAICQRKLEGIRQVFYIYTTRPVHASQIQVKNAKYKNQSLYKYASVKRRPCSNQLRVTFEGESKPSLMVHRTNHSTKIISYRGQSAALTEDDGWDGSWNSYLLTVRPGVDPCLMLCMTAISDEVEEG